MAMILEKLLNAHLCTCCFLKDALGETPRVRQIWTLSALKNKLSHSTWDRQPDNPSVCGLCKHWLCLHELQKPDYGLFFFFFFGILKYTEILSWVVIHILCTCSDSKSVWTHTVYSPYAYYIITHTVIHAQWFTPTRSEHKTGYILFSYAYYKTFFSIMWVNHIILFTWQILLSIQVLLYPSNAWRPLFCICPL